MLRKNPISVLPVQARIKMLKEAVAFGSEEVGHRISRALRDRSPSVRATAAELIAVKKDVSFLGSLHKMLSDPSELVRSEAIDALGVIEEGSGRHYDDLVSRIRDRKPLVRIAAIESLTLLRDFSSIPQIQSCLHDPAPLVRSYAAIALAELGCNTCLNQISNALETEKDEAAAAGLMVALHTLGDQNIFPALLALLSSKRYRVRCFVANSLPRLKLSGREIDAAKAAVEKAFAHPLGRADASTMSGVRKVLRSMRLRRKGKSFSANTRE